MKRFSLILMLAGLLAAGSAMAKMGAPVKVRLIDDYVPAQAGEWWTNTLEILAGQPGMITNLEATGPGWIVEIDGGSAPVMADPDQPLRLGIRALGDLPDEPISLRFEYEGSEIQYEFEAGERMYRERYLPQTAVRVEEPIPLAGMGKSNLTKPMLTTDDGPAAKDLDPSLREILNESDDLPTAGVTRDKAARDITVHGRVVYLKQGEWAGVDGATVKIMDEDWSFDNNLGSDVTDSEGNFSITVTWDPCGTCENEPDIYVEVVAKNSWVVLETPVWENNYKFKTGTIKNFTGTDLSVGNLMTDADEDHPGWHVFTNMTRVARWVRERTWDEPSRVDVQWPTTGGAFYRHALGFQDIHIPAERQWWDDTHAHEYGHHFINEFGASRLPDYCNSWCDVGSCGHCSWCKETDHDAWAEGWPSWLADIYTREHQGNYGYLPLNFRDREFLGDCVDATNNNAPCPCDPLLTEGFVSALLRDIEDSDQDDDPFMPGADELSLGIVEILQVTTIDKPKTSGELLAAFYNRFPEHREAFWATAAENGFEVDNANPFPVDDLVCTDHTVGVPSPDATLRLTWSRPEDDASGVVGYSIEVTEGAPVMPDEFVEVDLITAWNSQILYPGDWYATIRSVDRSGKAASTYDVVGPFTIRTPDPANLAFDQNPGWYDEVVPRSQNDAGPTYLPAPVTLTGNSQTTYWSYRVINTGEAITQGGLVGYAMTDGVWNFNFNSNIGYTNLDAISGGGFDNELNNGPVSVRGGRHTFGVQIDYFEDQAETNENDNYWARQWVWSPLVMPIMNASYDRSNGPPDLIGGHNGAQAPLFFNSDGFRFTGSGDSWYAASLVMDDIESDYDIRLHDVASGPTDPDGFGPTLGWSTRGPGFLDAVFVNGRTMGAQDWDVGVVQGNLASDLGGFEVTLLESTEIPVNVVENVSWAWGDQILLREFYIAPFLFGSSLVSIVVRTDPADGPLYVHHLDNTFTTGDINDFDTWGVTDPVDGVLRLDLVLPYDSRHGLVVYRDPGKHRGAMDFTLEVDIPHPDLKPTTLAGWHGPLVPHTYRSGQTDAPAPSRLSADGDSTWISLAFENDQPVGVSGSFATQIVVDGEQEALLYYSNLGSHASQSTHYVFPFHVQAGRHTLGMHVDAFDAHPEVHETNNDYAEQWIWEPPTLQMGQPVLSIAPPDLTGGFDFVQGFENLYYNAHGYRTPVFNPSGTDERWGVVVAMPEVGIDVDLRLHEMSTGAKDGFGPSLAMSGWGPGQTEFVLINFEETPLRQFDVGVVSGFGSPPGLGFYLTQATHSTWVGTDPTGQWGPFPLVDMVVALHEVEWTPGTKAVRLVAHDAVKDLGISVYPGNQPFLGKSDVLNSALDYYDPAGSDESVWFNIPETDTYVIAVWMVDGSYIDGPLSYSLDFDEVSDVPEAGPVTATRLAKVQPNPFNPQTTIMFEMDSAGQARVDIYDVRGKRVRTLLAEEMPVGRHDVVWNGKDDHGQGAASGTYLVLLRAAGIQDSRRIMLLK